nr:MAG TPA: hypothetical protein [Caudoviricetes sp.]
MRRTDHGSRGLIYKSSWIYGSLRAPLILT